MAATGADFLQGLNMILSARQERERFQLQQSLAMMQFVQQKRVQDIQIASETLKLSEAANQQQKHRTASRFITNTGLGRYYLGGEGKKRTSNIKSSIEALQKEKKFSADEAGTVVTALWSYHEAKDPDPIIGIAANIGRLSKMKAKDATQQDKAKLLSYSGILLAPGGETIRPEMQNVIFDSLQLLNNERMITKEMMEFAKGDYEIQSDIGLVDAIGKGFDKEAAKKGGTVDLLPFSVMKDLGDQAVAAGLGDEEDWEVDPGTLMGGGYVAYATMKGPVKDAISAKVSAQRTFYKELSKDIRRVDRGGMSSKKFRSIYNLPDTINKQDVIVHDKKAMEHIARQAKRRGWNSMKSIQALKGISDSKLWKGIGKVFKYPAKMGTGGYAALTMFGQSGGGLLGEALGDEELGKIIGRGTATSALATRIIANKIATKPAKMSFITFLTARLPKIGSRAAVMAMADSPGLPFGDILALGYTIHEVYATLKMYREYAAKD